MSEIQRWYDKSQKLGDMMTVLSYMSEKELNQVAKCLYQVVNIHWKEIKSYEELISIGKDKLFGYYKAYQKRRWYDQNSSLRSALNILSTMKTKDIDDIIDGFMIALKETSMYDLYIAKKKKAEQLKDQLGRED
ncbi:MAG TPA: hypothetical protein P5556_05160 [Candidatus Gastranaerophilales bacterium]|nr:hypothetical protein [Candidatus Gastranaerophilales bacterium]